MRRAIPRTKSRRRELGQHLHARGRRLEAGGIGIQAVDRVDHVAEIRVARVSVHPRRAGDTDVANRKAATPQSRWVGWSASRSGGSNSCSAGATRLRPLPCSPPPPLPWAFEGHPGYCSSGEGGMRVVPVMPSSRKATSST